MNASGPACSVVDESRMQTFMPMSSKKLHQFSVTSFANAACEVLSALQLHLVGDSCNMSKAFGHTLNTHTSIGNFGPKLHTLAFRKACSSLAGRALTRPDAAAASALK